MSEDLVYFGEVKVDKNKKEDFDFIDELAGFSKAQKDIIKIIVDKSFQKGKQEALKEQEEKVRLLKEEITTEAFIDCWQNMELTQVQEQIKFVIKKYFEELAE